MKYTFSWSLWQTGWSVWLFENSTIMFTGDGDTMEAAMDNLISKIGWLHEYKLRHGWTSWAD